MRKTLIVLAALVVPATALGAEYSDPDAPETVAAARAALANAKPLELSRPPLEIAGRVLEILGLGSDIGGRGGQVGGQVRDMEAAMRDLGAKVSDKEIRIELPADVLFDFDKASIRPDAHAALRKVAAILAGHARAPVAIEGHTDGKGRDAYNQKLSEARAASVKDWLVRNAGVAAERLRARGWGMSRPVAPNTLPGGKDNPEGRQKNRRVEIVVQRS